MNRLTALVLVLSACVHHGALRRVLRQPCLALLRPMAQGVSR
jgi:hypothetical protein